MTKTVLALVFGASVLVSARASAVEPASPATVPPSAVGRAEIDQDLLTYYGGERASAELIGGLGVASLAVGGWTFTQGGSFASGLRWPLLGFGVLEAVGGVFYFFQVNGEIDHYRGVLARDPAAFESEELTHLRGTQSRFIYYRLTELAVSLIGVASLVYGFMAKDDFYKGFGLGFAIAGIPLSIIDTLNDARASWYAGKLAALDPKLTLQIGEHGAGVALSARF